MARIGDVIEIPTVKGFAYAQITHRKPSYGPLLRVLEGTWQEPPADPRGIVAEPARFHAFFPVDAAVRRGVVRRVGNVPVPDHARRFPLLRGGGIRNPDGSHGDWWPWDGDRETRLGQHLTAEQKALSTDDVVNDTLLIERIATDWHPGDEFWD